MDRERKRGNINSCDGMVDLIMQETTSAERAGRIGRNLWHRGLILCEKARRIWREEAEQKKECLESREKASHIVVEPRTGKSKRPKREVKDSYGTWRVIDGPYKGSRSEPIRYLCRCVCGTERLVPKQRLLSGASGGCGKGKPCKPTSERGESCVA